MQPPLAAAHIVISETLLWAEVKAGRIRQTQVSAGRHVYLRGRLDAWLDQKAGMTREGAPAKVDCGAMFAVGRESAGA